jgi:PAS domain-containing protein
MDKWLELQATGEPGEVQARLRRHDGVFRWFLFRTEPLRDAEDLKQTEEKLRKDERDLRVIADTIPLTKIVRWYATATDIIKRGSPERLLLALNPQR